MLFGTSRELYTARYVTCFEGSCISNIRRLVRLRFWADLLNYGSFDASNVGLRGNRGLEGLLQSWPVPAKHWLQMPFK